MPGCEFYEEVKPMKVSFTVDFSAAWKLLMRGGAAKVKTHACNCCSESSDELDQFKTNDNRCPYCIENNKSECVRQEMNDAKNIKVMHRCVISITNKNDVDNYAYNRL